ncbi:hypothetical protein [Actinoplanes sp. NPDC026623]|uniref:hypothetical protein n=1 Tax=Actinoplanes sp. NPDC026623 TaxID=3155610 RepID=UPI0034044CAB
MAGVPGLTTAAAEPPLQPAVARTAPTPPPSAMTTPVAATTPAPSTTADTMPEVATLAMWRGLPAMAAGSPTVMLMVAGSVPEPPAAAA